VNSIEFPHRILALQSTSAHFYVSISSSIQVFNADSFRAVKTVSASCTGDFSASEAWIAFPDDSNQGFVALVSTADFESRKSISCHTGRIRALRFARDGRLLTSSTKGTLIRAFSVESGGAVAELRRGFTQAVIVALAGSDRVTVACSETTVHAFVPDGAHARLGPPAPPIACETRGDRVATISRSGILSLWELRADGPAALPVEIDLRIAAKSAGP
jgi:WD40 repeat protein